MSRKLTNQMVDNIQLIWIDGRKYQGPKLKKYVIENIVPTLIKKIAC